MAIQNRRAVVSQLLADLEQDLRDAQARVKSLQNQCEAARLLLSSEQQMSALNPKKPGRIVQLVRAKNVGDLAYQYLLDHCPDGATAVDLHKMLVADGHNVGRTTYIYAVLDKLEAEGRVVKINDENYKKGRYVAKKKS
jgi:hypothetical protein